VILDEPIPNKGKILTAMSNFWFRKFGDMMPNHETGIDPLSLVTEEERAGRGPRHRRQAPSRRWASRRSCAAT
jgi:phosphoribosylaminoimidazole-succinocarboxamide synthase